MNMVVGLAVFLVVGLSAWKYKPACGDSRGLCALTAGMGLLSAYAGSGNFLFLSVQSVLLIVVACCCFLQLRREHKHRQRRARAVSGRACGRMPSAQNNSDSRCA